MMSSTSSSHHSPLNHAANSNSLRKILNSKSNLLTDRPKDSKSTLHRPSTRYRHNPQVNYSNPPQWSTSNFNQPLQPSQPLNLRLKLWIASSSSPRSLDALLPSFSTIPFFPICILASKPDKPSLILPLLPEIVSRPPCLHSRQRWACSQEQITFTNTHPLHSHTENHG